MNTLKPAVSPLSVFPEPDSSRQEVRCAVRFPLVLPVVLSGGKEEFAALTQNVSASGVLFELDRPLRVALDIVFPCACPVRCWVPLAMCWFIVLGVWYAAP